MGISSCFGSPLLNDVIGLSVALIVSHTFSAFLLLKLYKVARKIVYMKISYTTLCIIAKIRDVKTKVPSK